MPSRPENRKKSARLRYAWIIASLAALGIVLSPISPFPLSQGGNSREMPLAVQPEEVTDEVLLDCGSLIPGVEYIVGGGPLELPEVTSEEETNDNATTTILLSDEEKLASNSLVGEFCNRPDLVRNVSSAYDPAIVLVAYGCDAGLGKIGDPGIQASLDPFDQYYCTPVAEAIDLDAASLIDDAQSFKEDTIPELRGQLALEGNAGNSTAVLQNAESIVDKTLEKANTVRGMLFSGSVYDAAKELDDASTMYSGMLASEEMSEFLGFDEE
jgi:hypothetical protein